MKGKGYITFMVAAALSMGFAVTAMAEEPGGGEPGGAQLGTMIEMADRLAPEGEDAAVISHIKGVTDSQGRLAVPMYQDAELVSVQAGAGTLKGEPKEQHSGMTSYLVADFDEADFRWNYPELAPGRDLQDEGGQDKRHSPGQSEGSYIFHGKHGTGVNRFLQPGTGSARGI